MQPKGYMMRGNSAKNGWVSCRHPAVVPTTKASSLRWLILTEWQAEQASGAGRTYRLASSGDKTPDKLLSLIWATPHNQDVHSKGRSVAKPILRM